MYLLGDCWSIYWLLCWPTLGRLSTEMSVEYLLSIDWHFGQVVFFCRSTDRPTVGQDSIGSLSAMYRSIVGRVLVRYQWCISRQFASPTIGRYIGQVMFTFSRVSGRQSAGRDSIVSVLPVYRWTVGRRLVRYRWCICRQLLLLSPYALLFVTRFLTSADTQ